MESYNAFCHFQSKHSEASLCVLSQISVNCSLQVVAFPFACVVASVKLTVTLPLSSVITQISRVLRRDRGIHEWRVRQCLKTRLLSIWTIYRMRVTLRTASSTYHHLFFVFMSFIWSQKKQSVMFLHVISRLTFAPETCCIFMNYVPNIYTWAD